MKIGVLGTGAVGQTLGKAFVTLGNEVKLGSRSASNEKAVAWAKEVGPAGSAATFSEAVSFGQMVVLATLGAAAEGIVKEVGPDKFQGKTVIDTTNPLDHSSGMPKLSVGHTDSLGERIQRILVGAHVVKAFNTVGNPHMFRPSFPGGPPDMFICGDNNQAKKEVEDILKDFGWGAVDLGGIESCRYLEPMCLAWVMYGIQSGTWNHAFKLLRK
jgi:predicted dinucleotide-binding enzyme